MLLLWCSNCTWKEGQCGGHDLDRGRVDVVDDAKRLLPVLPVRVPLLCCLSVTISIVIAIVGLRSGCSCCRGVLIAVVVVGSRSGVLFRLQLKGRTSW